MLLTDSDGIATKVDALRNQGRLGGDWLSHELTGYNYRLSDIQAAVGLAQLRRINTVLRRRKKAAQLYSKLLQSSRVRTPIIMEGRSWFTYVVEIENRDEVAARMSEMGIECKPYFPPVHLQNAYRNLGFKEGDFPICEEVGRRVLALPFFTQISKQELLTVASTLRQLA
jgi:perosamine synthetase